MLDNHAYNLMNQLTQEHKSLWRIENHYQKDADGCDECTALWERMLKDKEAHVAELSEILKRHM